MTKRVLFISALIFLLGCSKQKAGSSPEETIGNLVRALNTQDSDLLRANLDKTEREHFSNYDLFRRTLDSVKGTTFAYSIIHADTDGTIANVSFWVSGTGKKVLPKSKVDAQFYKEDGAWKFGAIMAVNGQRWR